MAADIPTTEPTEITAGDTVKWYRTLDDYSPDDSWALSYAFVIDGDLVAAVGVDQGDGRWLVTLAAATTAAMTVGSYSWQAYVTKGSERFTVDAGTVQVLANFQTASSGYDDRSHVKKVLDALESVLEGESARHYSTYSISIGDSSRSITHLSRAELIDAHRRYKALYAQEQRRERIENGLGHSGQIRARF